VTHAKTVLHLLYIATYTNPGAPKLTFDRLRPLSLGLQPRYKTCATPHYQTSDLPTTNDAIMSAPPSPSPAGNQDEAPQQSEHLNIKVTDNNNEVFFKIKRTTQLKKLMDAFCDRQGKSFSTVRFLFDGTRVNPTDNPEMVSCTQSCTAGSRSLHARRARAN
jgi:hypothetical protein